MICSAKLFVFLNPSALLTFVKSDFQPIMIYSNIFWRNSYFQRKWVIFQLWSHFRPLRRVEVWVDMFSKVFRLFKALPTREAVLGWVQYLLITPKNFNQIRGRVCELLWLQWTPNNGRITHSHCHGPKTFFRVEQTKNR